MAKKVVASLQKGEGRAFAKVIKMVKSPKTGAYMFQEEIVLNEKVNEHETHNKFANKTITELNKNSTSEEVEFLLI